MMRLENPNTKLWHELFAFYLALFNVLMFSGSVLARAYVKSLDDEIALRRFVLDPNLLSWFPIWVLSWIIAITLVGNRLLDAKRLTWYGVGALLMLAVPAVPVAIITASSYWRFALGRHF